MRYKLLYFRHGSPWCCRCCCCYPGFVRLFLRCHTHMLHARKIPTRDFTTVSCSPAGGPMGETDPQDVVLSMVLTYMSFIVIFFFSFFFVLEIFPTVTIFFSRIRSKRNDDLLATWSEEYCQHGIWAEVRASPFVSSLADSMDYYSYAPGEII